MTFSIIPKFGGYFAVPIQIGVSEKKAGIISHFKMREFVANLSKIAMGGWGSEPEADIWKKGTAVAEFLGKLGQNLKILYKRKNSSRL